MLDFHNLDLDYDLKELEIQFFESIEKLRKYQIIESEKFLNESLDNGKKILAEGAQGSLLDVDFGTYPFVTSSTTTAAGASTGLGIAPNKIREVFGIFKAYTTRVGSGPFPTELFDDVGKRIAKIGNEFGATTGRARRCGWLDLVALKYSIRINGVTQLIMMKGDVLSGLDTIKVCNQYQTREGLIDYFPFDINPESISAKYIEFKGWKEDLTQINSIDKLPKNFIEYINFLERELKTPIKIISVGPDRKQTITK